MATVSELLSAGTQQLRKHDCAGTRPDREAEELLGWAANLSREALFAHPDRKVTAPAARKFAKAVAARLKHAPIEYLTSTAQFMGRDFRVTKSTLIPRPATEIVTAQAILEARRLQARDIMDVGTGSGAIAITLACAFPKARVLATDISRPALAVARKNAETHGVAERVVFVPVDLLPNPLPRVDDALVIVANLPYVPTGAKKTMAREVSKYEPATALFSGKDGLVATRRLLDRLADDAAPRPIALLLEILPEQYDAVAAYAAARLPDWKCGRITNDQNVVTGALLRNPAAAR